MRKCVMKQCLIFKLLQNLGSHKCNTREKGLSKQEKFEKVIKMVHFLKLFCGGSESSGTESNFAVF